MPLHLPSLLDFSTGLVFFPIILSCSLLLAFELINCGARLGLLLPLCLWLPRCQHLNWFITFLANLQLLDFGPLTPPDNITLKSANRKADQSLSGFQTGVGAVAHATLDMEQLISHLQVALVDTLSSVPEAEGGVMPVSEVRELLLRIHGILDKAVSKQVANSAHILAFLFNSVSRQCCVVWASQFPFSSQSWGDNSS